MKRIGIGWLAICCMGASISSGCSRFDGEADRSGLRMLYGDDIESGAVNWEYSDPGAWRVEETGRGRVLSQFQASDFEPPHRSPYNYALLKDLVDGDFVLEVDVFSTKEDYNHRDVCFFFGFQDSAHYYYAHLAKRADDRANNIFIVNEAPRARISTTTTEGTPWDDSWHRVRIVRTVADGGIEVYFDDMTTPAMTATDATLTWGRVGLGTFDDTAQFDNFKLWGRRAPAGATEK